MKKRILQTPSLDGRGLRGGWSALSVLGFALLYAILAGSCGSNSQYTNKLVAEPFVSKLHGQTTKIIALSAKPGEHIAWIGLMHVADYEFFHIDQISVNGTTKVPEAIAPSINVLDITVPPPNSSGTAPLFDNMLLIKMTYQPAVAIESDKKPHQAYLVVNYDKPSTGSVRIELNGYTSGKEESKCTADFSSMDKQIYQTASGTLDLYFCHESLKSFAGQVSAGFQETNLTHITVDKNFVFYQPDEETVCILAGADPKKPVNGFTPSIPEFNIPVPKVEGLNVDVALTVNLKKGLAAECQVGKDGVVNCGKNIELNLGGLVNVTPLSATNNSTALSVPIVGKDGKPGENDTPISTMCHDKFTEMTDKIIGSGKFGEDMTLVAWGQIVDEGYAKQFNVGNALVVAVIQLVKGESQ